MIKAILTDLNGVIYFEGRFNEELLEIYKNFKREKNINIYLFSAGDMQNRVEIKEKLKNIIEKYFGAHNIFYAKSDPAAYSYIAKDLNLKPEEIIFIDDIEVRVDAAKAAGFQTILYTNNAEVLKSLQNHYVTE